MKDHESKGISIREWELIRESLRFFGRATNGNAVSQELSILYDRSLQEIERLTCQTKTKT